MDYASLPSYPRDGSSAVYAHENEQWVSPRARRNFRNLAVLVIFVWMLVELRWITEAMQRSPPAPRVPLAFELVKERWPKAFFLSREKVESLLGPPSERRTGDPEFQAAEEQAEHSNRHVGLPKDRFWDKWIDPKDEDRWVAILYAGSYPEYKAYWIIKKGF